MRDATEESKLYFINIARGMRAKTHYLVLQSRLTEIVSNPTSYIKFLDRDTAFKLNFEIFARVNHYIVFLVRSIIKISYAALLRLFAVG